MNSFFINMKKKYLFIFNLNKIIIFNKIINKKLKKSYLIIFAKLINFVKNHIYIKEFFYNHE